MRHLNVLNLNVSRKASCSNFQNAAFSKLLQDAFLETFKFKTLRCRICARCERSYLQFLKNVSFLLDLNVPILTNQNAPFAVPFLQSQKVDNELVKLP